MDNTQTDTPVEWWYDEGVPGKGPKPDYLEEKYGFNQAKQAKAYRDARAELGRRSREENVPDQYDLSQFEDYIDEENPRLKNLLSYAKQRRFAQKDIDEILGNVIEYEKSFIPNEEEELEKLGPEADKKIKIVEQWIQNTIHDEETLETIEMLPKTARTIKMLDNFRKSQSNDKSAPPSPSAYASSGSAAPTVESIKAEMAANGDRYLKDESYRNQINAKLREILGE